MIEILSVQNYPNKDNNNNNIFCKKLSCYKNMFTYIIKCIISICCKRLSSGKDEQIISAQFPLFQKLLTRWTNLWRSFNFMVVWSLCFSVIMESTSLPLYHKRGPKSLQKRRYSRPSPPQDHSGLEFIKKCAESAAVYILEYPSFVKNKMFSTEFEMRTVLVLH